MTSNVNYDIRALERRAQSSWQRIEAQITPTPPTVFERVRAAVAYGGLIAVVGWAAFYATPGHAAGAQSNTPSIIYMGEKAKLQMRVDNNKHLNAVRLEAVKSEDQLKLEEAKSLHRRQLEEDKAYYKKLEWQRKNSK